MKQLLTGAEQKKLYHKRKGEDSSCAYLHFSFIIGNINNTDMREMRDRNENNDRVYITSL